MTVPVGRNDTQQTRDDAWSRFAADHATRVRFVTVHEAFNEGFAAAVAVLEAERDTLAEALREANGAATKADDPGHIYVRFPCAAWDILRAAAGGADTPTALRDALWEIAHFVVDPDDDPAYCFAEVRKIARAALAAGRAGTP